MMVEGASPETSEWGRGGCAVEYMYEIEARCECGEVLRQWLGRLPVGDVMRAMVSPCPKHPEGRVVLRIACMQGKILLDVGGGARVDLGQ